MSPLTTSEHDPIWHQVFAVGHPDLEAMRRRHAELPAPPRCRLCLAPFKGTGGETMEQEGRGPSHRNANFCAQCDVFIRDHPGGAEVEMGLLMVDMEDSTGLAERRSPKDWSETLTALYREVVAVLDATDGFVIDHPGDSVFAVYPPGFSGETFVHKTVEAGRRMAALRPSGQALRVAAHVGPVYISSFSARDLPTSDVSLAGDAVHVVARMCKVAQPSSLLVSSEAAAQGPDWAREAPRTELNLAGREKAIVAHHVELG